ncbi:hypothetical protein [Curtobacterium sp. MCSS17_015]|uniref:hypothetical protein n=1 Tax=Curtobacterium sp. MCSS17_015 TaxID=2175666 RepID=UPI000DAA3591|nr:hypothetical protein [Curtobacterium sp. MCSS17_015]WIB25327.1 hypothetical protein DEJ18_09645 [Curtobacterium sp. MCSS17_015]
MKKVVAIIASVLAVASVLVGFQLSGPNASQDAASAVTGSSFSAGNIISDANFYDGDAMSAAQIQSFLTSQIGTCASSSCLNVGRFSMNSRGSDPMCGAVTGGSNLTAAVMISRVAMACGISPKVLLVTLQKEQSLINGSVARNPSASRLERAMGYACPDNVGGRCDPAYAGVGNQVYWSAWQWKRYGNPAGTSNYFTWFNPGGVRQIQYNVPVSCGTKSVTVQNKATAALYYYTPYTPNTAALNNLYGTGDSCSAYGNRNFWRMYNDWFGSPTASSKPIGRLDSVVDAGDAVRVRGWAIDQTTTAAARVHVFVDSAGAGYTADSSRPDVGKAYPGSGDAHGFDLTINAGVGKHEVCASAISVDGNRNQSLGCKTVTVTKAAPEGRVDSVKTVVGGIAVRGWTYDPNQPKTALTVKVSIGGKVTQVPANRTRADVGKAYPTAGSVHGYEATIPTTSGSQKVCVTAVNVGAGRDAPLGSCTTVRAVGSVPDGRVDAVTAVPGGIAVRGWAIDGDTANPINVDVYVDGVGRRIPASTVRPDIGSAYPAFGSKHGYETTLSAKSGKHQVCVYAINTGAGSGNPTLGCRTVEVGSSPVGRLDSVTPVSGGVTVNGWAYDPDTGAAPITVRVSVGSAATASKTGKARPDVAKVHPAAGGNAGYVATVPAPKGVSKVCVSAVDANGGADTTLRCTSVTVQ